jgi:hypothetical protein
MIRNLKFLVAAAVAMAAFGAIGSAGAQAAEFHCSVSPCQVTMKPDGTGKNAHHVINVTGGGFSTTCGTITGEATLSEKTSSEITIGNLKGENCVLIGQQSTLTSNGCHYLLNSAGTLTIACPEGEVIENNGGGCQYDIPPQGPLSGVSISNTGSEITVQLKVKLTVSVHGAACPGYGTTAEFSTANSLLTGETAGGEMANLSWE